MSRATPGVEPLRPGRLLVAAALSASFLTASGGGEVGAPAWSEGFDRRRLDPARWAVTAEGDFRERTVDVVDVGGGGASDFRLRLRADTRGTRDDTVKFLGARSRARRRLRDGARIAVHLDWNDQANGSYLSAGVVLAAQATDGNPLRTPDWLSVEYVGVPPGRNARLKVDACSGGRTRTVYAEGWPETNRSGRPIGVQRLELVVHEREVDVWENGRLVFAAGEPVLTFDEAYLYLQLSSHSNYPPREVYFDEVRFAAGP